MREFVGVTLKRSCNCAKLIGDVTVRGRGSRGRTLPRRNQARPWNQHACSKNMKQHSKILLGAPLQQIAEPCLLTMMTSAQLDVRLLLFAPCLQAAARGIARLETADLAKSAPIHGHARQ